MTEIEIWKPILGYEGSYDVSNLGRIRSVTRTRIVNNCHGGVSARTDIGTIMSLSDNGHGYKYVLLANNGVRKHFYVHRLVATAFLDPPDIESAVVDHKDHDRANNRAINLQWVTQKENVKRSAFLMRNPRKKSRAASSGEKYIRNKKGRFEVNIRWAKVYRSFNNIVDAVRFRDEVIQSAERT